MRSVPSDVANSMAADEVFPVTLFELGNDSVLRYSSINTVVLWNGHVWLPRPIGYASSRDQLGTEISDYTLTIDNYDQALTAWARLNNPRGYESTVYEGCHAGPDGNGNVLLVNDYAWVEFSGLNATIKVDAEFTLTIKGNYDMHKSRGPGREQSGQCRFRGLNGVNGFKGPNCGYVGAATVCDFTYTTCAALGNRLRFGGFPDLTDRANQ